ncbi:hypothetical protein [Propylenella binzhouense]|uniref:Uncharacterized protein n=1 Tax=Propylenella binzhouense TaxID=2555902 RepID=A0A964T768_9HYPH|nr:hypothetical protein [Propylenella binzhouense]MYZ49360.1 hypothetical protein [Propylenella binzhouense]
MVFSGRKPGTRAHLRVIEGGLRAAAAGAAAAPADADWRAIADHYVEEIERLGHELARPACQAGPDQPRDAAPGSAEGPVRPNLRG